MDFTQYGLRKGFCSGDAFRRYLDSHYNRELGLCFPDQQYNIRLLYSLVSECMEAYGRVAVVALDAVSCEYFLREIVPAGLDRMAWRSAIYTSVFPSTSTTAWASIMTGLSPEQHGIYGASFRETVDGTAGSYVLRDDLFHTAAGSAPAKVPLICRPFSSIFERCRDAYSVFIGRMGINESNQLFQLLTRGVSQAVDPGLREYLELKKHPSELLRYVERESMQVLDCHREGRLLLWSFFDLDAYIHVNSYEPLAGQNLWERFAGWIQALSQRTNAVLLLCDHGQTPQRQYKTHLIDEIKALPFSTVCLSGAGRVLYLYGNPKKLTHWAQERFGETAHIFRREDLFDVGLLGKKAVKPERIGDVVLVAKNGAFQSFGERNLCEHGACSEDELFVPCALYTPT